MAWVSGEAVVLHIGEIIDNHQVSATINECGTKVVLHLEEGWLKHIPIGSSIHIRNFRVTWKAEQTHVFAFYSKGAKIFVHPHQQRGELRFAELFGGIGGWTNAGKLVHMPIALIVESDLCTATACSRSHNMELLKAHDYIEKVLADGVVPKACVLHADLRDHDTWVAIALANVAYGVASPPCQPWSGAGESRGLLCEDGLVMKMLLWFCGIIKIHTITIENVPGFPKHSDFHTIIASAAMDGLTLCCHGTHGCHLVLPVQRERWLGIFVSSSVQISASSGGRAKAMSFAHPVFRDAVNSPTIGAADCIHTNMTWSERNDLILDMSMRNKMNDPEMAPQWIRSKLKDVPGSCPFDCRIINKDQQMMAIMASYGSQHEFDESKLKSKGLQTTIFAAHDGERLFSPWEFLASMGYPKEIQVSCDPKLAWRMAGNGITVAHAWLALYKVHILLGSASPMSFPEDISSSIRAIQENCIRLSTVEAIKSDGFWYLIDHVEKTEPESKKPRLCDDVVSPTLRFVAECKDVLTTSQFDQPPAFESICDHRKSCFQSSAVQGGVVMLVHEQKNWTAMVNCAKTSKVSDIIRFVLPHASVDHFKRFVHQKVEVNWDDTLTCVPMACVVFEPNSVEIQCFEESLQKRFWLLIDTTWKTRSVLAYIAVNLGCNPDVLCLQVSNLPLKDDDFLREYETYDFQLKFKACLPTYVEYEKRTQVVDDPGFKPSHQGVQRFYARHPCRKIVRTIVADAETTFAALVNSMFPDISGNTPWSVFVDNSEVEVQSLVWDATEFDIQWNGMRPLVVTKVSVDSLKHPADSGSYQSNLVDNTNEVGIFWIRTPFKCKASPLKIRFDSSLGAIADSFLLYSQVQVSMLCMMGEVVLDPCILFRDIDPQTVVSFRVCPLLGGGKQDNTKHRIKKMLEERGVSNKDSHDRMQSFVNKISLEKLQNIDEEDHENFWQTMKGLANQSKFRLVQHHELKQNQSAKRATKPPSKKGKGKGSESKSSFTPVANELVVDPSHFWDGDTNLTILDASRFGSDVSGLCILNASDARKIVGSNVKSVDALAVLIIDADLGEFGEPFTMPAHLKDGTPVIVRACLIQFGDRPVEYKIAVPTIEVPKVASTTIEFVIIREFAGNWDDTAVPLLYLGKHVPNLRGNNLLSTWSIKAWKNRSTCHFSDADHWHGFFSIGDTLLHGVLSRSGSAGIFMNPKSADKKHDSRFTTVIVPNHTLCEVQAQAESCVNALGVTRVGDKFAIRCRREHQDTVRAALLPESAFVGTPQVDDDQQIFILKNMCNQFNKDELTAALKRSGWNAVALRPQGFNRWLIAAKDTPAGNHLVINGSIAIVEPLHRPKEVVPITMVAREISINTTTDGNNQITSVSTTSRIAEVRAEIEAQISEVVDQKLATAHAKIAELSQALESSRQKTDEQHQAIAADITAFKDEQAFTRQKIHEVESSVAASSQTMIQQMQGLFAQMQQNIETSITNKLAIRDADINDKDKRQRIHDDTSKQDHFASRS